MPTYKRTIEERDAVLKAKEARGERLSWDDVEYGPSRAQQDKNRAEAESRARGDRVRNAINRTVEGVTKITSPAYDQRQNASPAENNAHSPGKTPDGKVVFSRED